MVSEFPITLTTKIGASVTVAGEADTRGRIGYGEGFEEPLEMAFIICDDHNLDVEADGIDNALAKQLMLTDAKPDATPAEKEIIEFGRKHRDCNIRILAG